MNNNFLLSLGSALTGQNWDYGVSEQAILQSAVCKARRRGIRNDIYTGKNILQALLYSQSFGLNNWQPVGYYWRQR